MSDRIVCKLFVSDNRLDGCVDILESFTEKVWLYFCKLIELDEGVFENGLILFLESLNHDLGHEWQIFDEFFCVLSLCNGQIV